MEKVIESARVLRNHLSQAIADAVRDGDMGKARALVDAPAWRFLGTIIGDLDQPDDQQPPEVTE